MGVSYRSDLSVYIARKRFRMLIRYYSEKVQDRPSVLLTLADRDSGGTENERSRV